MPEYKYKKPNGTNMNKTPRTLGQLIDQLITIHNEEGDLEIDIYDDHVGEGSKINFFVEDGKIYFEYVDIDEIPDGKLMD